jgi:hypothetical protein
MSVGPAPSYAIDGTLGVKLTDTEADSAKAAFEIGKTVMCNGGAKFMYTQALSSVAAYDAVSLNVDSKVAPLSIANASANGGAVAFAQNAIASGSFGWVALSGNKIRVNVAADSALGAPLFATATAGTVDNATGTSGLGFIAGLRTLSSSTAASALTCIAQNAHVSWFGNVA